MDKQVIEGMKEISAIAFTLFMDFLEKTNGNVNRSLALTQVVLTSMLSSNKEKETDFIGAVDGWKM